MFWSVLSSKIIFVKVIWLGQRAIIIKKNCGNLAFCDYSNITNVTFFIRTILFFYLTHFCPPLRFRNICCPRDCVSRYNGGTSGAPLKPLRVDSALKWLLIANQINGKAGKYHIASFKSNVIRRSCSFSQHKFIIHQYSNKQSCIFVRVVAGLTGQYPAIVSTKASYRDVAIHGEFDPGVQAA